MVVQHLRKTQEDCRVSVVSAFVGYAEVLGMVREFVRFLYSHGVHVRTEKERLTVFGEEIFCQ